MLRTKLVITKKFTKRNTVNTENKGVMKPPINIHIRTFNYLQACLKEVWGYIEASTSIV